MGIAITNIVPPHGGPIVCVAPGPTSPLQGGLRAPIPINLTALRAYRCAAQGGAGPPWGPSPLHPPFTLELVT